MRTGTCINKFKYPPVAVGSEIFHSFCLLCNILFQKGNGQLVRPQNQPVVHVCEWQQYLAPVTLGRGSQSHPLLSGFHVAQELQRRKIHNCREPRLHRRISSVQYNDLQITAQQFYLVVSPFDGHGWEKSAVSCHYRRSDLLVAFAVSFPPATLTSQK